MEKTKNSKCFFVITEENERALRSIYNKKGNMSKTINLALKRLFEQLKPEEIEKEIENINITEK
ncbi:MAG: hypothetical protein ACQCN5_07325 [Candidatus Bathyarchaeia archaeon]|jgi:hypothetical protein